MRIGKLVVIATALFAGALPGLTVAPGPAQSAGYRVPVVAQGTISGFFDPAYRASENRQHLGVDLPAPAGTQVVAPVRGVVTFNHSGAGVAPDQAFIVIRDTATGVEHVLGHIDSQIRPGTAEASVERGAVIGAVKRWITAQGRSNSHVHWGVNTRGVPVRVEPGPGGDWGWGRAPASATQAQAEARGWINLNAVTQQPQAATRGGATPAPAPRAAAQGQTPEQLARALFANIARPSAGDPLWWRMLSRRTAALHRQLLARQERTGDVILDYDWLCQCQDPEGITVQRVQVTAGPAGAVNVRVWFRNASGETDNIMLAMVDEGGWKIDDIVDRNGRHFLAALSRR